MASHCFALSRQIKSAFIATLSVIFVTGFSAVSFLTMSAISDGDISAIPGGPATRGESSAGLAVPPRAQLEQAGMVVPIVLARTATVSISDIPSPALLAYQRAEAVLANADPACGLTWRVLAAIGQVLNHHGTINGHRLAANGFESPALVGPVVTNTRTGRPVADTDNGLLDSDRTHDRAVGPLSLAPTTWSVAGVDADNDGHRDPQDINDATLAVAVIVCSGPESLTTAEGLTAGLHRLANSEDFIQAVLTTAADYRAATPAPPPPADIRAVTPPAQPSSPSTSTTGPSHTAAATVEAVAHVHDHASAVAPWSTEPTHPARPSASASAGQPSSATAAASPSCAPSPSAATPTDSGSTGPSSSPTLPSPPTNGTTGPAETAPPQSGVSTSSGAPPICSAAATATPKRGEDAGSARISR